MWLWIWHIFKRNLNFLNTVFPETQKARMKPLDRASGFSSFVVLLEMNTILIVTKTPRANAVLGLKVA